MRPRTPLTPEQIVAALDASGGNVEAAAARLNVSGRTLYRRIKEYGIAPRVRYEVGEAA